MPEILLPADPEESTGMKFPAECQTAEDRAVFWGQLKREMFLEFNATADRAKKSAILKKQKIVRYWLATARKECSATTDEAKALAIEEAIKAEPFTITAEHRDIDYERDRAATQVAL